MQTITLAPRFANNFSETITPCTIMSLLALQYMRIRGYSNNQGHTWQTHRVKSGNRALSDNCHLLPVPVGVELVPELLLAELAGGGEAGHGLCARRPEWAHADRPLLHGQQPRAGVPASCLTPGPVLLVPPVHCVGDHARVRRDRERPLTTHH